MITDLIKTTAAYKIFTGDKKAGRLAHAYAVITKDEAALPEYTAAFAKTLFCKQSPAFCGECRTCRLIEKNVCVDVTVYPKKGAKKIVAADIDELVAQTYVKPLENDERLFILNYAETMTPAAQNKLLKTLEEPPQGVFILLGVSNEYSLLSTVKSRVRRLEIPDFSDAELISALKGKGYSESDVKRAVSLADGKEGEALRLVQSPDSGENELAYSVLIKMTSTRNMLDWTAKIDKDNIRGFLLALKKLLSESLEYSIKRPLDDYDRTAFSREAKDVAAVYPAACIIKTIEKINYTERALAFNGNVTMLADDLLLTLLEEKYRSQKL